MKWAMLAGVAALAIQAAAAAPAAIGPGDPSITDDAGHVWSISPSGSIQEDGAWVPGGGGTASLIVQGGTVYGLDAHGRGWFTLSDNAYWLASAAPPALAAAPALAAPVAHASLAAPVAAPVAATGSCSTGTGQFGIFPSTDGGIGQIYDQNQQPWFARGINVMEPDLLRAAGNVSALFPGINFLRVPIYNLDDDPAMYADAVQALTSAGIVVEFEDHTTSDGTDAGGNQGAVFTGALLDKEQQFYSRFSAYYKPNGAVWWGTNNEPPNAGAALSAWQMATVATIRATGNQSPILIEVNGWADPSSFGQGYDLAAYQQGSNLIADVHIYGWLTGYSTDQARNNAFVADVVSTVQQRFKSAGGVTMPVIIGEHGNSTTGMAIDPNGTQMVEAVQQAGRSGIIAGSAAWAYGNGNPGDGLMAGGGLSAYGRQVAGYISSMASATAGASRACAGAGAVTAQADTHTAATAALLQPEAPGAPQPDVAPLAATTAAQQQQAASDGNGDAAGVIGAASADVAAQVLKLRGY